MTQKYKSNIVLRWFSAFLVGALIVDLFIFPDNGNDIGLMIGGIGVCVGIVIEEWNNHT